MNPKKTLTMAVFMEMLYFGNVLTAADLTDIQRRDSFEVEQSDRHHQDAVQNEGRVSLQAFLGMTHQQIQTVHEILIPLSESYSDYRSQRQFALNHQLGKNPNITVFLDCTDATRIGDHCLASISSMCKFKIIHAENVENIGDAFLYNCSGLTTLDLRPLSNVANLGNSFLYNCSGLTTLDLTLFSNLTSIGDSFLSGCAWLTTLDLTPLSKVREIKNYFLSRCCGLTTLNLSPLSNATDIGIAFLHSCTGLTALDLSLLLNLRSVGNYFLTNCEGLTREHVTIPQNWCFEDRLPENLRLIESPTVAQPTQNACPAPVNPQRMINDLSKRYIDPNKS